MHAARVLRTSPARNSGEIHPGLLVAGVLVALGLAWWFARSDGLTGSRASTSVATTGASATDLKTPVRAGAQSEGRSDGPEKALYRWTDAAGVVHFTDVAPVDRPYVRADVDPDRNVVRSSATPEP